MRLLIIALAERKNPGDTTKTFLMHENIDETDETYTGVSVVSVAHDVLDELYETKQISAAWLPNEQRWQNQYVIVKNGSGESSSALARVRGSKVHLLNLKQLDKTTQIQPRNKEQYFALDALTDDSVKVTCLTGRAGTGKTILALAAAMSKMTAGIYKKIILTKPSSEVGRRGLGYLPGTAEEKFLPFLINFVSNFEVLFSSQRKISIEDIFNRYNIEIVPLQLMRGASFNNCFVLADEIQVCNSHEMLTLGTRLSEGSKLVIMGDLNQRDEQITKEQTGLYKFINNHLTKSSTFTASVHMRKSERGDVSELFSSVFEPG